MTCPKCKRLNAPEATICIKCKSPLNSQSRGNQKGPRLPDHLRNNQLKEYKVITQKDNWFTANFDSYSIQKALNELALEGWRLVTVTTQRYGGIGQSRDEIFFFLERDLP